MSRLQKVICPFCDNELSSREGVVRCRNCGECFEVEPDEEEFVLGLS